MGNPLGGSFRSRYRTTQPRPWVSPLPTTSMEWNAFSTGSYDTAATAAGMQAILMQGRDDVVSRATNKAVANFNGTFSNLSNMALTLLERKQTVSMIAKRGSQLLKGARQIRKFDFRGAAKTFGVTIPKRASRKKQFADNWLEFHFGWSPLVGDIGEAVKVLQGQPPSIKVRATGTASAVNRSGSPYVDWPSPSRAWAHQYSSKVTVGARIIQVNPDLALANALGFTDPATLAWESIPFSFVVDWFANVADFLSQMSATIGYTLSGEYTKILYQASGTETSFVWAPGGGKSSKTDVGRGWEFKRLLGLPSVSLKLRPFNGFSPTRGLTAISLLVQFLKNGK